MTNLWSRHNKGPLTGPARTHNLRNRARRLARNVGGLTKLQADRLADLRGMGYSGE